MSEDVKQEQLDTQEAQADTPATTTNVANGDVQDEPFKPGQVVKPEEVEKLMASLGETEDEEELRQLYEKSFLGVREEDIVKGKILEITPTHAVVDIGFKSEAIVSAEEFVDMDKYKVGDEVELFLEAPEDVDGNVVVSRRKVYFMRAWERLMDKYSRDEVLEGRIVRRIKGGFVVDLDGVDAFLPGSQVDVKPIRDFDAYVGQTLPVKIVKVNEQRKNIVVSRRVIVEKELESKRQEILATLEKGQVRRGVVKNITDFGVFIDLGGVDGLLHITDLSWGRVGHPSEVVELDQEIDVMILDFDENKTRISLGLKQLQPHPWENIEERYPVGEKVKGRVVSITDYGAFVELEPGIEGLIHVSEMSWSHHVKHPSQILQEGQEVECVLLNIEPNERKISLGLKQLTPDPWEDIEDKYPVGSRHKGIVRNLTPFGAFVELEEGIDGLVHISDLSWTRKIRHPSEVLRKGQEIEVVVLDINKEERRIALGHKQIEPNPWDTFEEAYKVGTETTGKVTRLLEKGVIVTLPLGVDAFVPINHLGKSNIRRISDHFKVGDELPLKVIEFDKDNKRIVLSVSEYLKSKEREIVEQYLAEHSLTPPTVKEKVEEMPALEELPDDSGRPASRKKEKVKEAETETAAEAKAETETAEAKAETEETAEAKAKSPKGTKAAKAEAKEGTEAAEAEATAEASPGAAEEASATETEEAPVETAAATDTEKETAEAPAEADPDEAKAEAETKKETGKKTTRKKTTAKSTAKKSKKKEETPEAEGDKAEAPAEATKAEEDTAS